MLVRFDLSAACGSMPSPDERMPCFCGTSTSAEDVVKKPNETLPDVFGFLGVAMPESVDGASESSRRRVDS